MKAHFYNTPLTDRTLWYDGDSSYDPSDLFARRNKDIKYVTSITPAVIEYNKYQTRDKEIKIKTECRPLPKHWNLPAKYANLDVETYVYDKLVEETGECSGDEFDSRAKRVALELLLYKKYKWYDVLRTIIYIINTLSSHEVVWGVGRGSSVSSYILYLIGVHDVDSYLYDLDINDFLHD